MGHVLGGVSKWIKRRSVSVVRWSERERDYCMLRFGVCIFMAIMCLFTSTKYQIDALTDHPM